jgi:hypothetical protein
MRRSARARSPGRFRHPKEGGQPIVERVRAAATKGEAAISLLARLMPMAPYRLAVVFLRDCLDAPRAILTSRVSQRGQLGREPHGEAVGGRGSAVVQVSHARLVSSLGAGVAVAAPPIRGGPLDVGARGGQILRRSSGGHDYRGGLRLSLAPKGNQCGAYSRRRHAPTAAPADSPGRCAGPVRANGSDRCAE